MNIVKPFPQLAPWTNQLAFEIALKLEGSGESMDTILEAHKVPKDDFLTISKDPLFQKKMSEYRNEIKEKGLTFKLKAKAQAELLLETSWELIHGHDVSPAVKADLIKQTVRWAGFDAPETDKQSATGGVTIHINLDGQPTPLKLSSRPVDADYEEAPQSGPKLNSMPRMPD